MIKLSKYTGNMTCPKVTVFNENQNKLRIKILKKQEK